MLGVGQVGLEPFFGGVSMSKDFRGQRAVLYARSANEQQSETGHSGIDSQLQAMREFAVKQGINVVEELAEVGCGQEFKRRILRRAQSYAKRRKTFDLLVVTSWDRLSRNPMGGVHVRRIFAEVGVNIVVVDGDRYEDLDDLTTPHEWLSRMIDSIRCSSCSRNDGGQR